MVTDVLDAAKVVSAVKARIANPRTMHRIVTGSLVEKNDSSAASGHFAVRIIVLCGSVADFDAVP